MERTHQPAESAALLTDNNRADGSSTPRLSKEEDRSSSASGKSPPTAILRHDFLILFLVSIYTLAAVFSWTIVCILSVRPIGAPSYSVNSLDNDTNYAGSDKYSPSSYQFATSERLYRAAKVINAGVGVLTMPLASAVCARAAVTFAQETRESTFRLRHLMALADQGWANPQILLKLLFPSNWKRYGSAILWLGILLHILGFLVSPLQQLVLSQKTIKTPVWPSSIVDQADIPDFVFPDSFRQNQSQVNIAEVRSLLGSARAGDAEANLWLRTNIVGSNGIATLGEATNATADPFVAQLPSTFTTGVIRQFAPRLNSTLSYEIVDVSEFPTNCDQLPGAFYVSYNGTGRTYESYSLQACMPANQSSVFWKPIRRRQDLSEVLYLNISMVTESSYLRPTVIRVQANSTAGYFELPNYMNHNKPGPLLESDPMDLCDSHCIAQWSRNSTSTNPGDVYPPPPYRRRSADSSSAIPDMVNNGTATTNVGSLQLEIKSNIPPLLTVALALFGENSFISTRTRNPGRYEGGRVLGGYSYNDSYIANSYINHCLELTPLIGLASADEIGFDGPGQCFVGNNLATAIEVTRFLTMLHWTDAMQSAFRSGLYLTHILRLTKFLPSGMSTLSVFYDLGADTNIPSLSVAGIAVVSTIMGLFLISLFVMTGYATRVSTWTSTLDAFAMMRIGASMTAAQTPLLMAPRYEEVRVPALDETPGWTGDGAGSGQPIGRLELGAVSRLRGGKRGYLAYPTLESEKDTQGGRSSI